MRVYIAAPLSTAVKTNSASFKSAGIVEYIKNLHRMFRAAIEVQRKGHYPYVPGLDIFLGIEAGDWERDDYQLTSLAFLEVCDAILIVAMSEGVARELKRAEELGLKVYYNIEEVPKVERPEGEGVRTISLTD